MAWQCGILRSGRRATAEYRTAALWVQKHWKTNGFSMIFKVLGVSGDTKIREKSVKNETLGPEGS